MTSREVHERLKIHYDAVRNTLTLSFAFSLVWIGYGEARILLDEARQGTLEWVRNAVLIIFYFPIFTVLIGLLIIQLITLGLSLATDVRFPFDHNAVTKAARAVLIIIFVIFSLSIFHAVGEVIRIGSEFYMERGKEGV